MSRAGIRAAGGSLFRLGAAARLAGALALAVPIWAVLWWATG